MTKKEIVETIKKMDNAKIIHLWNECVEEKSYPYNTIYTNNCAFFNTLFMPFDAVLAVMHGHYNENDDYVIIDESENVQSFTNWDDAKSPVDVDVLVDWLFEKENIFENYILFS